MYAFRIVLLDACEWSKCHEESEWSLMISLRRLFCNGTAQDVLLRGSFDCTFHVVTDLLASRRSRGEAMLRGGSFVRSGAGLELHEEWKWP